MANKTDTSMRLYDLLVSRGYELNLLDSAGKNVINPDDTEIFSFDFTTEHGKDYGTVVILLGSDNDLEIFFADNIGKTMDPEDKEEWFEFLQQIRMFAKRNLMSFGIKNINQLRYSMQGQRAIKEGLFESWHGNKNFSYNDNPNSIRLMIKHRKPLAEADPRYRFIESLFLETSEGERFKLPFNRLDGGRAMLEHVRNGGKPYDAQGQHIASMVNEITTLRRFQRANNGKIFEGECGILVSEVADYYESAKRTLKSLASKKGYQKYFESWDPAYVTKQDLVVEQIKEYFASQKMDSRIEEALPILAKVHGNRKQMREARDFERWVNVLSEGRWVLPQTKEKQAKLVDLMSQELPVGADAINATEQLYNLLASDALYGQLASLANADPNADARPIILSYMGELSKDPSIQSVLAQLHPDSSEDGGDMGADQMAMPPEPAPVPPEPEIPPEEPIDQEQPPEQEPMGQEPLGNEPTNELPPEEENEMNQPVQEQNASFGESSKSLAQILKLAGVGPQDNPAPDIQDPTKTYPSFATEGFDDVEAVEIEAPKAKRLNPADYDQEGAFSKSQIHSIVRNAKELEQVLADDENLPEWLQAKLERAHGMMQTVNDYIQNNRERDVEKDTGIEGFGTGDILNGFEDELDEGPIGAGVGKAIGSVAGAELGPIGSAAGGAIGSALGSAAGDKLGSLVSGGGATNEESMDAEVHGMADDSLDYHLEEAKDEDEDSDDDDKEEKIEESSELSLSRLQTLAGFLIR